MSKIWSDERKFQIWLEIEVLACEAMAELGQIPKRDAVEIRKRARFSIPEILEIEKRTNHDVIAFLENVAESVGPAARWIHQGLTSSDILDTTLAVQLNESCQILLDDLQSLRDRVPSSPAHRSSGSRRIFWRRPERQLCHAAQAQSNHERTFKRIGARHSRERSRCVGKRGALARARHQSLERRANHSAGLMHPARLHARQIARHYRKVTGLSRANGAKSGSDQGALFQSVGFARAHAGGRRAEERVRSRATRGYENVERRGDIRRKRKARTRNCRETLTGGDRSPLFARHSFQARRWNVQSAWLAINITSGATAD